MAATILTVDDAATIRRMVTFTLKGAGHEVIEACDGVEALKLLQVRTADVIISDINMPNMDGIEFTRQIRTRPEYAKTPIILLTTESDDAKKQAGRAAGATGWIVKPFSQEQLLGIVARVLPAMAGARA